MRTKAVLSWSGGKDSALALYELGKTGSYEIVALVTTIAQDHARVSMHGVRQVLLEQQAKSLGVALEKVFISTNISSEEYGYQMQEVLAKYQAVGVRSVVFGDIFLEDIRQYRQDNLSKVGMRGIFPLWKRNTDELARMFIDLGFEAVVSCVDSHALDKRFVGREFDEQFLSELPDSVDPCGENGEFHSFVYDGPIFRRRILCTIGDVVLRENRFYYCDLVPVKKRDSFAMNALV